MRLLDLSKRIINEATRFHLGSREGTPLKALLIGTGIGYVSCSGIVDHTDFGFLRSSNLNLTQDDWDLLTHLSFVIYD